MPENKIKQASVCDFHSFRLPRGTRSVDDVGQVLLFGWNGNRFKILECGRLALRIQSDDVLGAHGQAVRHTMSGHHYRSLSIRHQKRQAFGWIGWIQWEIGASRFENRQSGYYHGKRSIKEGPEHNVGTNPQRSQVVCQLT